MRSCGNTTLSASGMLLSQNLQSFFNVIDGRNCENGAVVVTVASIVEPFLSQKSKVPNFQVPSYYHTVIFFGPGGGA